VTISPSVRPQGSTPTPAARILITGSRSWDDENTIREALTTMVRTLGADGVGVTLVHGACPDGADAIADRLARSGDLGKLTIERHPAAWAKHGKRAGFLRNQAMVDRGADVCFAFIRDDSKGATMTARIAESAGIQTYRFLAGDSA
jgi:hypothetical protein